LNLPQDFCGAPMLGKAAFLAVMMQPPLASQDLRQQIMVSTPFESDYAANLDALKETKKLSQLALDKIKIYHWEEKLGRFVEAKLPTTL